MDMEKNKRAAEILNEVCVLKGSVSQTVASNFEWFNLYNVLYYFFD